MYQQSSYQCVCGGGGGEGELNAKVSIMETNTHKNMERDVVPW